MRKTLLIFAFGQVLLLAFVCTFSAQYALACCIDQDGDGYGIAFLDQCPHPNQLDCNDYDQAVNPGATEGPYGGRGLRRPIRGRLQSFRLLLRLGPVRWRRDFARKDLQEEVEA